MSDTLAVCIATLAASIIGAILHDCFTSSKEEKRIIQEKINILNSLKAELIALNALIDTRKKEMLPEFQNNDPNNFKTYKFLYLPASFNYFTIYDGLSPKLGMMDNKDLTTEIICGYCDIKGLWENLRDLEYVAKKGWEYRLNEIGSDNHIQTIKVHSAYVNAIITNQLPIVENAILYCIEHISQELNQLKN